MISFTKSQLAAAMPAMAKKDVRFYLMGALVECCTNGDIHIVSTDGHVLFAGLIPAPSVQWTGDAQKGPWRMIIPRDALVSALKTKNPTIDLVAMPDGRYMIGDTVFTPVDGVFPNWRGVSVSREVLDTRGEVAGQFDPALLGAAHDALKTWFDGGKKFASHLHQHGQHAAVMTGDNMSAYCIVMPWRSNDAEIRPFTPAAY